MPSFKITITRISEMTIESEKGALEEVLKRMPPQILDAVTTSVKMTVEDIGQKPCRWYILNGTLSLHPLKVPSRKELSLLAGDHQNDLALVGAGGTEEPFFFLRGVDIVPKQDLTGALVPHLAVHGHPIVAFDKKHMVASSAGGVWVTKAMLEQIAQLGMR
jgi:hypothetical protein